MKVDWRYGLLALCWGTSVWADSMGSRSVFPSDFLPSKGDHGTGVLGALGPARGVAKHQYQVGSSLPTIEVTNGMHPWLERFAAQIPVRGRDAYDCRAVKEIQDTFLCQFSDIPHLSEALIRTTMFVEGTGGWTPRTIASQGSAAMQRAAGMLDGHDLKGADLRAFYNLATRECKTDSSKCLNPLERRFYAQILPELDRTQDRMVVIAIPNSSPGGPVTNVVSHEIMHAQYFLQPHYREVADRFWNERIAPADQQLAIQSLSQDYNTADLDLVRNEVQAYLLERGASGDTLGPLVDKYRGPFLQAMARDGIHPIQVAP
jgi:hypothetical protein